MPDSLSFREIAGVAALGGMGLTVSLIIAELALSQPSQLAQVKAGLIISAILSGVIGLAILHRHLPAKT